MTKKIQGQKSSLPKKKIGRKFTTKEARKGGLNGRRERISDLLTQAQKQMILDKCIEKANEGDTVMLKSMQEQIWGRPVATLETKVDAQVTINVMHYGNNS